jgi:hypothetical protein
MKKKIIGLFVCMLLITNILVIIDAKEEPFIKEKIESMVFSAPNIQEGGHYITLNMGEATSYLMQPGKPVLPLYTKIFEFPFGTKIKGIECNPSQINQEVISGEIQPSPEPVPLTNVNNREEKKGVEDFIIKDNAVYNSMDFFPYRWYDYGVGCGLDDSHHMVFLTVQFYPVRYSPGQHMIQYANKVDIKVEYYEPTQPVVFPDKYDMVVITPSEFSEQLQPLVDYKNDSSVATKLVTLDEIYNGSYFPVNGRDDQEKIKYFIKDAVEEWNITYVLLAGGANKIPVRMSYVQDGMEESLISDLYYADIYDASGNFCSWDSNDNDIFGEYNYQGRTDFVDLYPDVRLGRLNFRDSSEVSGVVSKIITYESTGAYMEEWFQNFVVCGGDTFQDYNSVDEGEYLNQNAIDMMNGFIPEKIWATNGKLQFAINIDNAITNGTGFLYMTGHGTFENWGTHPHNDFETWWPIGTYFYFRVEALNNEEKLPIVIIGGCSNCEFLEDNCFGWSFVKNPDGGGIASYGNSALGWGMTGYGCTQGLTGGMELSAFKAYGIQNAKTAGELWTKALNNYLNQFGAWSALDYKTVEEWQPFNDPSLRITKVSDKPNKPEKIYGPTSGEIGKEYTYTTSTTDPDGDLIKYCFDWDDNTVTWTERLHSGENASLNHTWEKPGNYEIKVKTRDEYGLDSEWSDPLLVNIVSEAPYLDIGKIEGGFTKIRTVITNIGSLEAYNVTCNVSIIGGMLRMIKVLAKETFGTLGVQEEKTVTASKIFGFGKIDITVTASAPSANIATKTARGFVVGPLIFVR